MRLLGVNTIHDSFGISLEQNLEIIKDAGFDCVFSSFSRELNVKEAVNKANSIGLKYETLHAPFKHCGLEQNLNSMWSDGKNGDEYLKLLLECIDSCADNGIEKCVIHNAVSENPPPISKIGQKRFEQLFVYAENKGIHMAIENLESLEHLSCLLKLADSFHGFCWDCGHNLCYTPMTDLPALYGQRMLCTHVDDNRGITRPGKIHYTDDLHLLPFDGNLDWDWYAEKIRECGYDGPLTLEIKSISGLDAADFYKEAYKRAFKLRQMCM